MVDVLKYPSVEQLAKVAPFFEKSRPYIRIEEKIDGSNVAIRFVDSQLVLQSRTTIIDQDNPGMFRKFVDWAVANVGSFSPYLVYYGEMVGNGKLRYPDAPPFLLFDIYDPELEQWSIPWNFRDLHEREVPIVKPLYAGYWQSVEHVQSFLGTSAYADVQAEGVVVKAFEVPCWYVNKASGETIFYTDKLLAGKVVREDYKETKAPRTALDNVADPLYSIAEAMVTEARVQKAIQRAQEEGKYVPNKPHTLIGYVSKDVYDENQDEVKEMLFSAYWKQLSRSIAKRVIEVEGGMN